MLDYEQIKRALEAAELDKKKAALFHYITFTYADELMSENSAYFCNKVGMADTYTAEFAKMRAMRKLMKSGDGERYLKEAL